jgi:hypothetical protein
MASTAPSPRGSVFSRSALPTQRRPPPVFNPAFTSAAGVTKDPEAFDRTRRAVARTYKAGEHRIQFFVRRAPPAPRGAALAPGAPAAEYTPRGTYVGDWEADTATQSTRGWSSKRWGVGTQVFPDGSRYEGSWFDDTQNGEGKLFVCRSSGPSSASSASASASGTPRKGTAKKLVLEYSGSWYAGMKHGLGKQTYAKGDVCVEGRGAAAAVLRVFPSPHFFPILTPLPPPPTHYPSLQLRGHLCPGRAPRRGPLQVR